MLEEFGRWIDARVSLIPVLADGSKAATGERWAGGMANAVAHRSLATREDVARWLEAGHGVAAVAGPGSGELELLELEGRAIAEGLGPELRNVMRDNGLEHILDRLTTGCVAQSPSGGIHLWYRIADGEAAGNRKLARRPSTEAELELDPKTPVQTLIETRGRGGYAVIPPTGGNVHETGRAWEWVTGGPETIPAITVEEREALHDLARVFDRMVKPAVTAPRPVSGPVGTGRPGDEFNAKATWAEILEPHGWTCVRRDGNGFAWRRPGKELGISATTGKRGEGVEDCLYVFTSSTTLPTETPLTKLYVYAHLEHGDDMGAAVRELRRKGYGEPLPDASLGARQRVAERLSRAPEVEGTLATVHRLEAVEEPAEERPPASWAPVDLAAILAGDAKPEEPTFLPRADGVCLFYPGKTHSLHGESESGKSWIAQYECARLVLEGRMAAYIDFESDPASVTARLLSLGVPGELIVKHFRYIRPEVSPTNAYEIEAWEALLTTPVELAVIDGVTDAMGLFGKTSDSNDDVAAFMNALPGQLAKRTGAAVVLVDHVVKDKETRGRYAVGGQHKMNAITGAAYTVDVDKPLGRGMTGILTMRIGKDRPGAVRPHCGPVRSSDRTQEAARITFESDGQKLRVEVGLPKYGASPDGEGVERAPFRPTGFMERISRALQQVQTPLSQSNIEDVVRGNKAAIKVALDVLVAEGYVKRTVGKRQALMHSHLKPYTESDDRAAEKGLEE